MHRSPLRAIGSLALVVAVACSSTKPAAPAGGPDSGAPRDAAMDAIAPGDDGPSTTDADDDANDDGSLDGDAGSGCFLSTVGVYGQCMTVAACAALGNYGSTPGYCPGAADIQCCTKTPNVADNPPVPAGWKLMPQSAVTPDMTTWAVAILHDPTTYPMFSTTMRMFGSLLVMARVEWHPPDFQNNTVHRGVTLYEPG